MALAETLRPLTGAAEDYDSGAGARARLRDPRKYYRVLLTIVLNLFWRR
jgi:hypothetical protein